MLPEVTSPGGFVGTLRNASREQSLGQPLDGAAFVARGQAPERPTWNRNDFFGRALHKKDTEDTNPSKVRTRRYLFSALGAYVQP